jgi:hypothetical protein
VSYSGRRLAPRFRYAGADARAGRERGTARITRPTLRVDEGFTVADDKMCCSRSLDRKDGGSGHVEELTLATGARRPTEFGAPRRR